MATFGSFGNVSPDGMQAVKDAIARRSQGGSTPALNQQSGGSPTASPLPPQPTSGVNIPQNQSDVSGGIAGAPGGNPEAKMILGAMKDRLKTISTIEEGGSNGVQSPVGIL